MNNKVLGPRRQNRKVIKERQTLIDRLEKDIQNPHSRNFLDTLSLNLLKIITPRTMLDYFFIKPPQIHKQTQTHPHTHATSDHKHEHTRH